MCLHDYMAILHRPGRTWRAVADGKKADRPGYMAAW